MARPTALLALAVLAPLAVYAGFSGYLDLQRRQDDLAEDSATLVQAIGLSADRVIAAVLDNAQTLAESPTLDPGLVGNRRDQFAGVAHRILQRHPNWMAVSLAEPDGRWVYSSDAEAQRLDGLVPGLQSLLQAVRTRRPVIGGVIRGLGGAEGVVVRAPAVRNGEVVYVVTVVLRPDALTAALSTLRLPAHWLALELDASQNIVARLPNEERLIGRRASGGAQAAANGGSGAYRGRTFDGIETQSFYWVSPVTHWSTHVAVPRTIYEAPLRRMLLTILAGFGVCLLLAMVLIVLWIRDFEARRAQASAVEQATRVDALGRLTGGVAHDFNNLLTVIQGNTDILGRRLRTAATGGEAGAAQAAAQAERPLSAIRAATDRAAKLTRQLLVFARGGPTEPISMDLRRKILDLLGALSQLAGPGVAIETDLETELPPVNVDPLQFEAAVLNLTANARDAMDGAGLLEIGLRREGEGVALVVRDHGPGFDTAVLARVFEPFFTTKPVGQGTGLGLSQVYGLVKGAGGRVFASNAPGGGAIVTLTFPPASAPPDPPADILAPAAPPGVVTHAEVLLVDDNDAVRATTAAFLREYGLVVIEAADAAQALRELEAAHVAAVLSDIVMPGEMDGMHLAQHIRQRWPELPVLLASGFSERAADAQARGFTVVTKPYSLPDLERRLRALVEQRRLRV